MILRHPLMPTKASTRHATHSNIIKRYIQNQCFFIEIKFIFDHFRRRFSSQKFGRLGEGLGLDFGFDFRRPKPRPKGIKKTSRKKMPTWAQHEPQHDPKRPPKTASWIGAAVAPRSRIRLLTAPMLHKPSWTPFGHHVAPFLEQFWYFFGPFWHHVGRFFDRLWTVVGSS